MTKEELLNLKPVIIDDKLYKEASLKWDLIQKPIDGLGDFEKVISRIVAINENIESNHLKKCLVVMCADHGIVEEGVSQCGQEVTLSVAKALSENISSASTMAGFAGVDCIAVDVGINSSEKIPGIRNQKVRKGTENFLKAPAMDLEDVLAAIEVGINITEECKLKGYNLLLTGEMGIGNTTSGTAVLCALTGTSVDSVIGRGAGLSDEGLLRKSQVIKTALDRYDFTSPDISKEYALNVMSCVGGLELAAMTGLFIGGALFKLPIMIDGALSAVSALFAEKIMPRCRNFMIPSHSGRERATEHALNELELRPLINGNMALGEGTGALMCAPLLDMAFDFYNKALTFENGNVEQYTRHNK